MAASASSGRARSCCSSRGKSARVSLALEGMPLAVILAAEGRCPHWLRLLHEHTTRRSALPQVRYFDVYAERSGIDRSCALQEAVKYNAVGRNFSVFQELHNF